MGPPDQTTHFHPLKYLAGMARAIITQGGRIYGGTRATSIQGDSPAVGQHRARRHRGRRGRHRQQVYQSYVIGLRVPKDAQPRVLLWDSGKPYYYVRLAAAAPGAGASCIRPRGNRSPAQKSGNCYFSVSYANRNNGSRQLCQSTLWTSARTPNPTGHCLND